MYVLGVTGSKVGKLVPSGSESQRALNVRVRRAARRLGVTVTPWSAADGAVYFKRD